MAEIHVQAKKHDNKGTSWLWIVIGLLIAAAVIYMVTRNKENTEQNTNTTPPANTTSYVESKLTYLV